MKKPLSPTVYMGERGFSFTDGAGLLGLSRAVLAAVLGLLARAGGECENERKDKILEHERLLGGNAGVGARSWGVWIALPPNSG